MPDIAVRVEDLSKKYIIGDTSSGSLKETIVNLFSSKHNSKTEEFWALKGINFEVREGEAIGIIGRNGAGKSTLLKILSRITHPTSGRIEVYGRVSSLLEVGTGFHPELTGRENIFLNGTILGMKNLEIKNKFDEIVDFSGVEKFLDTPVKRYSSGMKVRLAFSVAAYLDPEILIIDEVLAVGDAEFQRKCLGKMEDVADKGKTVLFVSHNMAAIENICNKAIWLDSGTILDSGKVDEVINNYLSSNYVNSTNDLISRKDRKGNQKLIFHSYKLLNETYRESSSFKSGQKFIIRLYIKKIKNVNIQNFLLAIGINSSKGNRITQLNSEVTGFDFKNFENNNIVIDAIIEKVPLVPGNYYCNLFLQINGEISDWFVDGIIPIIIEKGDFYNTGKLQPNEQGAFFMEHRFEFSV